VFWPYPFAGVSFLACGFSGFAHKQKTVNGKGSCPFAPKQTIYFWRKAMKRKRLELEEKSKEYLDSLIKLFSIEKKIRPCPACEGKLHITGVDRRIYFKCDKCDTEFSTRNMNFYETETKKNTTQNKIA
jgi:hypothetical protein